MSAEEPISPRPAAAGVPGWVSEHYRQIDAAQVDAYTADFAPDVELRYGSSPPIRGLVAVREALERGHADHAMAHVIVGCWQHEDTTILELDTTYTFRDGHTRLTPSVAILHHNAAGLLDSVRVYLERPR
jgi:hypothetical protein